MVLTFHYGKFKVYIAMRLIIFLIEIHVVLWSSIFPVLLFLSTIHYTKDCISLHFSWNIVPCTHSSKTNFFRMWPKLQGSAHNNSLWFTLWLCISVESRTFTGCSSFGCFSCNSWVRDWTCIRNIFEAKPGEDNGC